jgi:hypothetical protein
LFLACNAAMSHANDWREKERKKERKKERNLNLCFFNFVSRLLQAKSQNATGFSPKVLRMKFSSML